MWFRKRTVIVAFSLTRINGPGISPLKAYIVYVRLPIVWRTRPAVRTRVSPSASVLTAVGLAGESVAGSIPWPGRNGVIAGAMPTRPGIILMPRGIGIAMDMSMPAMLPMPGMLAIAVSCAVAVVAVAATASASQTRFTTAFLGTWDG